MTKAEMIKRFEELESQIEQQDITCNHFIQAYGTLQEKVAMLEKFISTQPFIEKGRDKEVAQ